MKKFGDKNFNFEDRLVQFAGDVILFIKTLPRSETSRYYADQMMRSSGSADLNYGEAQGTTTTKDFIYKMSLVLKEIRETTVNLKILTHVKYGNDEARSKLEIESKELAAISAKMILNKKKPKSN